MSEWQTELESHAVVGGIVRVLKDGTRWRWTVTLATAALKSAEASGYETRHEDARAKGLDAAKGMAKVLG